MKYRRRHPPLYFEPLEPRRLLSTYYVSTSGNDSNPGTLAQPYKTIQAHVAQLLPGDIMNVLPGTYAGFVVGWDDPGQLPYGIINGTAASPITIQANPGSAPGSVIINSRNAKTADGINIENSNYIIVQGFTLTNNGTITRAGIRSVTNTNVTIRNNNADHMGTWGIFTGFSQNVTIENNTCSNSQTQHGIYVSNSADNPVVRGNVCFGNQDCGIHMNSDASAGGDGVITNALVENNIIFNNGTGGGSGLNFDGVQNSRIQNNLLYNNHASGISLYRIDGAQPAKNNLVINNTIIMASDARWALNIVDAAVNNTVYNNILLNNGSRGAINISSDSLPGFTSDYNAVKNLLTPNDGGTFQTLSQWRTTTGQDAHSFVATAAQLFVNATGNDYHLSAASLALNTGTTLLAPTYDRDGNPRPSGTAFDIGAFERQVATPSTIAGRFLFYNNSAFDTLSDSNAIATDKTALLPGQTASFANYSSYSRGINGLFIDIAGPVASLSAADFSFKIGNDDAPSAWPTAPAPTITQQSGAGVNGTTRITLIWPDNAVQKTWLQVTVLANSRTGLSAPDTFYFGNAIGDSGGSPTDAKVNATDELAARFGATANAPITSPADYNRDGIINAHDQTIARSNGTYFLNQLNLVHAPAAGGAAPALAAALATGPFISTHTLHPIPPRAFVSAKLLTIHATRRLIPLAPSQTSWFNHF